MATLAQRLADLREQAGYSVNRLAREAGLTEGAIRAWEKGRSPRVDNLERVASLLGVSIVALLSDGVADVGPGLAKARKNLSEIETLARTTRRLLTTPNQR